mmetsp:Transcript_38446/g.81950  ORF Transcript_38446/g.81950 Transcript_38446/m.81950 type:complete len:268 (+) Transcript_38446:200-1003(+)
MLPPCPGATGVFSRSQHSMAWRSAKLGARCSIWSSPGPSPAGYLGWFEIHSVIQRCSYEVPRGVTTGCSMISCEIGQMSHAGTVARRLPSATARAALISSGGGSVRMCSVAARSCAGGSCKRSVSSCTCCMRCSSSSTCACMFAIPRRTSASTSRSTPRCASAVSCLRPKEPHRPCCAPRCHERSKQPKPSTGAAAVAAAAQRYLSPVVPAAMPAAGMDTPRREVRRAEVAMVAAETTEVERRKSARARLCPQRSCGKAPNTRLQPR